MRRGRRASAPGTGAAGRAVAGPSATARPSTDATGSATCSARSTCTPTTCGCRARPRRDGASTLGFLQQIRLAYPHRVRIYWIQDGLSCHWTPAIRAYAEANNIELVPTPTYASYL